MLQLSSDSYLRSSNLFERCNVFKILKVLFGFATGVRFLPILLTKEYFCISGWSKQQTRSCFSYFWSVEYDTGHPMLHKMADRSVRQ